MYAVFSACGKQYKVKKGDTVRLELLEQGLGETVSFNEVLLAGEGADVKIGRPYLDKALVKAEILGIEKGPKIDIVQYKRRKQYKRHIGHRQPYTRVLITEVNSGSAADSLSSSERDAIIKRIGFSVKDQYSTKGLNEADKAKKATQLKAKSAKQSAKIADAKVAKPVVKKAKKKTAGAKKTKTKKKAPAKKAAAKKAD